jgi:hypothetical protein
MDRIHDLDRPEDPGRDIFTVSVPTFRLNDEHPCRPPDALRLRNHTRGVRLDRGGHDIVEEQHGQGRAERSQRRFDEAILQLTSVRAGARLRG